MEPVNHIYKGFCLLCVLVTLNKVVTIKLFCDYMLFGVWGLAGEEGCSWPVTSLFGQGFLVLVFLEH